MKSLPSNPRRIQDLEEIPAEFRLTLCGDNFLLYDSHDSYEDDDWEGERVIVFGTNENLKYLFRSNIWFLDGTFKVSPNIFFQLFSILGTMTQNTNRTKKQTVGVPLIHALLENKQMCSYKKVLEVAISAAQSIDIDTVIPDTIMTDFEMSIIQAVNEVLGHEKVQACFFHLCQNVHKHVVREGLKAVYEDETDDTVRFIMCIVNFSVWKKKFLE